MCYRIFSLYTFSLYFSGIIFVSCVFANISNISQIPYNCHTFIFYNYFQTTQVIHSCWIYLFSRSVNVMNYSATNLKPMSPRYNVIYRFKSNASQAKHVHKLPGVSDPNAGPDPIGVWRGLGVCISNNPPGDTHAADPWTTLGGRFYIDPHS